MEQHAPNTIEIDSRTVDYTTFDSNLFTGAGFDIKEVRLTVNRPATKAKIKPLKITAYHSTPVGSRNTTDRYGVATITHGFNGILQAYANLPELSCRIERITVVSVKDKVELVFMPFKHDAKDKVPSYYSMTLEKLNNLDASTLPIEFLQRHVGELMMNSCFRQRSSVNKRQSCDSGVELKKQLNDSGYPEHEPMDKGEY